MQVLNPSLKLNARIPNMYPEQTTVCKKEVLIPVTTNAAGEAFFKLFPGSRPCDKDMATTLVSTDARFFNRATGLVAGVTYQDFDLSDISSWEHIQPSYLDSTSSPFTTWALQSAEMEFVFTGNFN